VIEFREVPMEGLEGRRLRIQQLGAKEARSVARRLLNVVGTALREAGGNVAGQVEIIAIGAILERIDDATVEYLTDTFEKVTSMEDTAGSEGWMPVAKARDIVFGAGKGLARWYVWMRACIEFSCGDFFTGLLAEARSLRGASPNASQNASRTSGSFTDSRPVAATRTA
jgi:hypothetical protein